MLLGARFGALGVAIGALATDENITKATEIGKNLQEKMEKFGLNLPDLTTTLESVQSFVGDGLDELTLSLLQIGIHSKKTLETAGLLAWLLIAPGPFMAGIKA